MKIQIQIRQMLWGIGILSLVLGSAFASASELLLRVTPDHSEQERYYLAQNHDSSVDLSVTWEGPFRVTNAMQSAIYRFDRTDLGGDAKQIRLKVGNSYHISLGRDAENFFPVLSSGARVGGLANLGTYEVDCASLMNGAEALFLKSENWNPPGEFGGCLFGMEIWGERDDAVERPGQTLLFATLLEQGEVVTLDGNLNEGIWRRTPYAGNFTQLSHFQVAAEPTFVGFAYDETFCYVGFVCYETQLEALREAFGLQRDQDLYRDNAVELFLGAREGDEYFHFAVNSIGTLFDERDVQNGLEAQNDRSFDSDFRSSVSIQGDHYEVEMAIPWRDLKIRPARGMHLAFQAARNAPHRGELSTLNPMAHIFHQKKFFGELVLGTSVAPPSFACNSAALSENPPAWQMESKVGRAPEENAGNWLVRIRYYLSDDLFQKRSARPVLERILPVECAAGEVVLADAPLPPGNYLVEMNYHDQNATPVFRAVCAVALPEEDTQQLQLDSDNSVWDDGISQLKIKVKSKLELPREIEFQLLETPEGRCVANWRRWQRSAEEEFALEAPGVMPGNYELQVASRETSGDVVSKMFPMTKIVAAEGTPHRFMVDENGMIFCDGERFFVCAMALPLDFAELAASHFNLVITGFDADAKPETLQKNRDLLDEAQRYGLKVAFHLCNTLRGKEDFETIKHLVMSFRNHDALAFWYLSDEPSGSGIRPAVLAEAARLIRVLDPLHPVAGCDNNPFQFGIYTQKKMQDLFLPDPYPIPNNPISLVRDWTARALATREKTVGILPYVQAQGEPWYQRGPTPKELRNMVFQNLALGTPGVVFWAHGPARESAEWGDYPELTSEIIAFGTWTAEATGAPRILENSENLLATAFLNSQGEPLAVVVINLTDAVCPLPPELAAQLDVAQLEALEVVVQKNPPNLQHFTTSSNAE